MRALHISGPNLTKMELGGQKRELSCIYHQESIQTPTEVPCICGRKGHYVTTARRNRKDYLLTCQQRGHWETVTMQPMTRHCPSSSQFPPRAFLFITAPPNFPFSSVRVSSPLFYWTCISLPPVHVPSWNDLLFLSKLILLVKNNWLCYCFRLTESNWKPKYSLINKSKAHPHQEGHAIIKKNHHTDKKINKIKITPQWQERCWERNHGVKSVGYNIYIDKKESIHLF